MKFGPRSVGEKLNRMIIVINYKKNVSFLPALSHFDILTRDK